MHVTLDIIASQCVEVNLIPVCTLVTGCVRQIQFTTDFIFESVRRGMHIVIIFEPDKVRFVFRFQLFC